MPSQLTAFYLWLKNALFHAHTAGEVCDHEHDTSSHAAHTHKTSHSVFVNSSEYEEKRQKIYAKALGWCLVLNFSLFLIQLYVGHVSYSITVLADAADLLGDSLNYLISLFILGAGMATIRKANLIKISSMLLVSFAVLGYAFYKFFWLSSVPIASYLYGVGLLSLGVNASCVLLLQKYKNDNANMYSAWACSINDMVGGVFILIVALCTTGFQSYWPDLIVGLFLVLISIYTSLKIWRITVLKKS